VKPAIVCDNASSDRHNCSCTCTNGITFNQLLDPFSSSTNGPPNDSVCQVEKTDCFERERQLKDENAKAHQDHTERERQLKDENASLAEAQQDHIKREQTLMDVNALLTKGQQDFAKREQALVNENALLTKGQQDFTKREQTLVNENALLTKGQQDCANREKALNTQLTTYQNKPAYTYQGCFVDSVSRVLDGKQVSESTMTVQRCESICTGFKYFGLQASSYCFCGQSFAQPTQHKGEGECDRVCTGDKAQKCGGGWRNAVYSRND
jgi:hypothetical protein